MIVIGLMSGTSVDGIDAALVEISGTEVDLQVKLLAESTFPYPPALRSQILALCDGAALTMAQLAQLDDAIAIQFAAAAQAIGGKGKGDLIGSHGQTVFHRPLLGDGETITNNLQPSTQSPLPLGYSLQLGRGEVIAHLTSMPTASNFRVADIAAGGQGAPLVSKIDACLLTHATKKRCVQNLGGIGNVTYLPSHQQENWLQICGWDTGPGNVLLDLAVGELTNGKQTYDKNGAWAAQGTPCQPLVHQWLEQEFFRQPPPKSTGRELFSEAYLDARWQEAKARQLSDADWLATLTELTVAAIVHSYQTFLPQMPDEVLLCGGGSRNDYLKQRLQTRLAPHSTVLTTDDAGLSSEFKEAIAFAVLAYWRYHSIPGNLPAVTGARQPALLGDIHLPVAKERQSYIG